MAYITHEFTVGNEQITLHLYDAKDNDGLWKCEIVKGYTGMGTSQGGSYTSLKAFTDYCVGQHTYCYNFFKNGHKAAKQSMLKAEQQNQ